MAVTVISSMIPVITSVIPVITFFLIAVITFTGHECRAMQEREEEREQDRAAHLQARFLNSSS